MVRHHCQRIAPAIALTLTLALVGAAPAFAKFDLNPVVIAAHPGSPPSTSVCSEVCSGGGYGPVTQAVATPTKTGAALPHDPRPRSVALASGGYGGANTIASRGFTSSRTPNTAVVRVALPSSGFHWGDAWIGAGGAFALTVLLVGGALGITHVRRRPAHSSTLPTT